MRLLVLLVLAIPASVDLRVARTTEAAGSDVDDPAVWIHPSDPSQSLILGTNKVAAPDGALLVFGLDGKIRQRIAGINRPNNVDVAYGLEGRIDIAVVTERLEQRLRVFRLSPTGAVEIGRIPVFAGETDLRAAPMGIALYKRPADGAMYAIVSRKDGPSPGYLWQYRLTLSADGSVTGEKVREFGLYSGAGEIEAVAVDQELGFVYYADEDCCIRKYSADPDSLNAAGEISTFGRTGWRGNREGLAIYAGRNGAGYIVATDQLPGNSEYHVFRRSGGQSKEVTVLRGSADSTDGLEAVARPMGLTFPRGFLVAMNSKGRNFVIFDWPAMLH